MAEDIIRRYLSLEASSNSSLLEVYIAGKSKGKKDAEIFIDYISALNIYLNPLQAIDLYTQYRNIVYNFNKKTLSISELNPFSIQWDLYTLMISVPKEYDYGSQNEKALHTLNELRSYLINFRLRLENDYGNKFCLLDFIGLTKYDRFRLPINQIPIISGETKLLQTSLVSGVTVIENVNTQSRTSKISFRFIDLTANYSEISYVLNDEKKEKLSMEKYFLEKRLGLLDNLLKDNLISEDTRRKHEEDKKHTLNMIEDRDRLLKMNGTSLSTVNSYPKENKNVDFNLSKFYRDFINNAEVFRIESHYFNTLEFNYGIIKDYNISPKQGSTFSDFTVTIQEVMIGDEYRILGQI